MFSFLFGVGFAIQMDRAAARGAPFSGMYLRRLVALLAFGLCTRSSSGTATSCSSTLSSDWP